MIITAGLFLTTLAQEVNKTGTTAGKFLSIGLGARANAMGGAYGSIANDPSAIYWNPAGISNAVQNQAMFTYTKMFADINVNYLGIVIPAGEAGSFGFSVTALTMNDMDVTTEYYPEGTGEKFGAGSYAFGLSYARNITEDFMVGATVKYVQENIYNSSASGVAFDIGTIFNTPFWGIRFSSSIANYGSKMQMAGDDLLVRHDPDQNREGNNETVDANYSTEKFELPLRLQIGLSKEFQIMEEHKFIVAVDAAHPNDNTQYLNIGGEISMFNNFFALRGGYKTLFMKDRQEGLTFGAGINYALIGSFEIGVDYAFQQLEYLDNIHSFGVMLKF